MSPVVCVFARKTSEPLTSLVKSIDAEIAKDSKLKSFVVFLTDDSDATTKELEAAAAKHGIESVPLTLVESPSGPPAYKIAKDAEVTVMMWRGTVVKANHAFAEGKMTQDDVKAILADLPKILEK